MITCCYGCGRPGIYEFKNSRSPRIRGVKKWGCSKFSASCPVNRLKNTNKKITKLTEQGRRIKREKAKQEILSRYEKGWLPKGGRCKKIRYVSKIAGLVVLQGTWEFEFAKFLDESNIEWRRNNEGFKYIDEKGKVATYFPDFYLWELKVYLEVKGYETEKDRCKWKRFPSKLVVIREKEIELVKKKEFTPEMLSRIPFSLAVCKTAV